MTPDTATASTATDTAARTPSTEAIDKIRAHHDELADQLRERTAAVLAAARSGEFAIARDELHRWYREQLLPHIVAEEQTLYSLAAELEATRLLVCGMQAEHQALVSLIAELALAQDEFGIAATAASAQALFTAHLSKENDLLLPTLQAAGLDLGAVLEGMHELLGSGAHPADDGCGCGHDAPAEDAAPVLVEITAAPAGGLPSVPAIPSAPQATGELDVRALPHGQRHEIIFARLDALAPGQQLVIVNDHDPKPLRYQTEALWPGRFAWTYRAAGPQVWRVAITRAG